MRMPAPKIPPAASIVPNFFSFVGPRVMDGTYTVKMIKGTDTYTTTVKLVLDPRSKHTREERAAQYETAMKLYDMLGRLTFAVDTVVDARDQARNRAGQLPALDPARKRTEDLAASFEAIRGRLVATRESGGITGEAKIREQMGALYGAVNGYEGRPTRSQINRMTALWQEFDGVMGEFDALAKKELPVVNAALEKKKVAPIKVMTKTDWDAKQKSH